MAGRIFNMIRRLMPSLRTGNRMDSFVLIDRFLEERIDCQHPGHGSRRIGDAAAERLSMTSRTQSTGDVRPFAPGLPLCRLGPGGSRGDRSPAEFSDPVTDRHDVLVARGE